MALRVVALLSLLTSSLSHAVTINHQCIEALCNIASGCDKNQNHCLGTGYAYCGPFRLSYRFWKDAGSPGDSFKSCIFDYHCSIDTINLYMSKYARDCNQDGKVDCDDFAAIHLAGGESSCSQKWLYSSSRYKKYLTLMSPDQESRTRDQVDAYELNARVAPSSPAHYSNESLSGDGEHVDEKDAEVTFVATNNANNSSRSGALTRHSRRINFPRRTTRAPSSRRYTVVYWNGNRRRLPEITNILDNNPWIIENARRTSTNYEPSVNFKPPISRRTYFNPTTPLTSTTPASTVYVTSPPTSTSAPFVPATVTRRKRVRTRTTKKPLYTSGRGPSNRGPSNVNPRDTTRPMYPSSTSSSPADPSTVPLNTPPPVTTVVARSTVRRPISNPATERPSSATTQAWWMLATRRRFPTYNWIESETTPVTNPWALFPSTSSVNTRRTVSRSTTSTTPITTVYIPPTTPRPSTTRTTTERTTTINYSYTSSPTTETLNPTATSTAATTLLTNEIATTRHVSFGPHRGRSTTESPETTVNVVTLSKKPKGILNDSSVTLTELKESCMECICSGSSETCNFDISYRCDKEDECGPYQIDYAYWYEAGYPNFKGNGDVDFHECATNRQCAEKTVRAYLEKNKLDCNSDGMIDCIDYAAVHKAGPDACHKQFVYESKYWTAFSQCHGFDIFKKR